MICRIEEHINQMKFHLTLTAVAMALATLPAQAATLHWDGTDTTADAGDGTWDNGVTSNWDNADIAGSDTVWTIDTGDTATWEITNCPSDLVTTFTTVFGPEAGTGTSGTAGPASTTLKLPAKGGGSPIPKSAFSERHSGQPATTSNT